MSRLVSFLATRSRLVPGSLTLAAQTHRGSQAILARRRTAAAAATAPAPRPIWMQHGQEEKAIASTTPITPEEGQPAGQPARATLKRRRAEEDEPTHDPTTTTTNNTRSSTDTRGIAKHPRMSAPSDAAASADAAHERLRLGLAGNANAPIMQSRPVLVLTDLETRIFGHVLAACTMFNLDTQVRVAGGWVRDKLLGLESDDIDFALDGITGEDFAGKLAEYLQSIGEKTSSVGVIKVNPDQSKHLATATMKVLGVAIDMNNFREEVYHPGSRIPEITLSTAKEDALRRDFCSNALFFNLNTHEVEDYVDGLADLRAGLLRTPRDPFKTFCDDPLRILRAARFAGRFGYTVHASVAAAASTPAIQADLATKVSRERMGIEVAKMLERYQSCFFSFRLLCQEWKLRRVVFEVPDKFESAPATDIGTLQLQPVEKRADAATESDNALTALCLKAMQLADSHLRSHEDVYSADEASSLLLASFLVPYYGYRTEVKKGRFNTLVWYVVRESLRLPQRDAQLASDLLAHAHQLIRASYLHRAATLTAAASASSSGVPPLDRLQLVTGSILRQTGVHSRIALRLAEVILRTLPQRLEPGSTSVFDLSLGLASDASNSSVDPLQQFDDYCQWIEQQSRLMQLPVWDMKPIATGTEVCTELGISAKGPHVGAIINRMLDWQMLHLEQLLPLYAATACSSAGVSSSSASFAPAATISAPDAAALGSVKAACFAWLRTQDLATGPPARK